MTNNILLILFQYFCYLQVLWYPVATYTFSLGLCYVFKKSQKLVLFYFFALTNGCNTCVLHFFPLITSGEWDKATSCLCEVEPSQLRLRCYCICSNAHWTLSINSNTGEKQAQTNKVFFLMASSPSAWTEFLLSIRRASFPVSSTHVVKCNWRN